MLSFQHPLFSIQRKTTHTPHTHSYLVFFRFVLVTSQVCLAPVHISCQDGEITFDSLILLHNKLSSCTSATLGSQFAGGIKYEVLNSVLFSLQSYLWKHKNWVTNVKIQSAYLQISGIFKSESYYWVCLGKEHQNNLPVLAPFSFENCGLRCHFIVDNFHR